MTLQIKEDSFLTLWAECGNVSLEFKDQAMLPGTAWIEGMPIDITIYKNYLVINAVGEFGGTSKSFAKSKNKGKGIFKKLYQHLPDLLKKCGLEAKIYLTPLSPVWKQSYSLTETTQPLKGHWYFLDTESQPPQSLSPCKADCIP